jgi:hypothetical protein
MMNCKKFVRKLSSFNRGTVPDFAWKGGVKQRKFSVSKAGVPAEIRTEHLPNTNLERHL